mgnify:CR=1 FL=1
MVVKGIVLDERTTAFAFRGLLILTMTLLLVNSRRQACFFEAAPFCLAGIHLLTSLFLWRAPGPRLNSTAAQAAAFVWDVCVVSCLMYFSEGFDSGLSMMFFLILFMSALITEVRHSFLIGSMASLLYAGLLSQGKAAADLPMTTMLLRFSFFYVAAFFTAVTVDRVRQRDARIKRLEMRLALGQLANGGWGVKLEEDFDPEVAKSVHAVNAVMDNLARALKKVMAQNEQLRETTGQALLHLAHEKERLEAESRRLHAPIEGALRRPI